MEEFDGVECVGRVATANHEDAFIDIDGRDFRFARVFQHRLAPSFDVDQHDFDVYRATLGSVDLEFVVACRGCFRELLPHCVGHKVITDRTVSYFVIARQRPLVETLKVIGRCALCEPQQIRTFFLAIRRSVLAFIVGNV